MRRVFKNIPAYFVITALTITVGSFVISLLNVPEPVHVEAASCIVGDANCDGRVDGVDFTIWLTHYNQTTSQGAASGDFSSDGKVDGIDFVIWVQNYGRIAPTPSPTTTPTRTPTLTPSRIPTATLTPTPISGAFPADVIGVNNNKWKMQLPINTSGTSIDIYQPQLATYSINPWFMAAPGGGVQFRAPVNGVTTSGSSYPRSELREMVDSAAHVNAAWSSTSGTHKFTVDVKVTKLPNTKSHLVIGQIHNTSDDVTVFRVEGSTLWITDGDTSHGYAVDTNFTLGTRFTYSFEVSGGRIRYYYKGQLLPYTQTKSISSAYFKAGAYTQANCTNSSPCSDSNYGEVVIYNITLTHQ
jgi:hypothetical protein